MGKLNLVSIDIGAGSGRVILSTFDGEKIDAKEVHRFSNNSVLLNDTIFWDFLNIIFEIRKGLLKAGDGVKANIDCIGVDAWGCDFGLLDKCNNLLSNPVSYRDKRWERVEQEIFDMISSKHLTELNSSLTYNFCTLFQLYYVFKYNRHISGVIDSYLPIPNLINYFLTGEKVVDQSILSGSQFFDVKERKYRKDILKLLNIPDKILPEIRDAGVIIGNLKDCFLDYTGLRDPVKVALICSNDSTSAVTGIPFYSQGSEYCYINSGTWSVVGIESRDPIVIPEAFDNDFTNWRTFRDKNMFVKIFNGFYFIQQCKEIWDSEDGSISDYTDFYKKIDIDSYACTLVDLEDDFLMGNNKGLIEILKEYYRKTGQEIRDSRSEYIISLLQSMVLEYKLTIGQLEKFCGRKFTKVFMVGGGSLNSVFCQWISDCLDKEVYTGYSESTINGNIIVQLYAMGEINSLEQGREVIRKSNSEVIFRPGRLNKIDWPGLLKKYLELKTK